MMRRKRLLATLLAVVFTASAVLTGCGKGGGGETPSGGQEPGGNSGEETGGGDSEDVKVVTYGGWENQIMAREMAERFNETHEGIRIEVVDLGGWSGNEKMTELAATGEMPDIINLENIVVPVQNDWIIDLKPYIENDPDVALLPENLLDYGRVNDKIMMLPGAIYLFGIMVNQDLLASNGIAVPGYNWTIDEFKEILKKTTNPGSTIGISEVVALMKHLPAQMNPDLGWGSFNEETKQYELGAEFESAANVVKELLDAKVSLYEPLDALGLPWEYEEGSAEQQEIYDIRGAFLQDTVGETDAAVAWAKGKAACWMDFTWGMSFTDREDYGGFEWDFYPIPLGSADGVNRVPFVVDSMAITSTCEYPEAAYEFMKFLSFSSEGIRARMDIVENQDRDALMAKYPDRPESEFEAPLNFDQMPISTDQSVIDEWAEFNNVKPGVKHLLEGLSDGYADGYKVTPGFDAAYHQCIEKTIKEEVFTGQKNISDVAAELQERANAITQEAYDALK